MPEDKIEVIYPGFPIPSSIVNQDVDDVSFIFVAGKGKFQRKGGLLLLKAFKILAEEYRNISLMIVGESPPCEILRKISTKIYPLGPTTLKTLYERIYPKANVLVLPTYGDGFPTVCAEAQGYGIPVITTNIWANPEIVTNNVTGFLISPGNIRELVESMRILIEDTEKRVKMGKHARQNFLKRFSVEVMRKKYCLLYTSLI